MTAAEKRALARTAEEALGSLYQYAHQCHSASYKLMELLDRPARVARGTCVGVGGQHSWVILGHNAYDARATIIDPTLWSYDESVGYRVWVGTMGKDKKHRPHGAGSIWKWERPNEAKFGEEMRLKPREPWSRAAETFLGLLGPLDQKGWVQLAHAPVEGWPAGEIVDAMCESGLRAYIPIDRVGMLTDPSGLYLPTAKYPPAW